MSDEYAGIKRVSDSYRAELDRERKWRWELEQQIGTVQDKLKKEQQTVVFLRAHGTGADKRIAELEARVAELEARLAEAQGDGRATWPNGATDGDGDWLEDEL